LIYRKKGKKEKKKRLVISRIFLIFNYRNALRAYSLDAPLIYNISRDNRLAEKKNIKVEKKKDAGVGDCKVTIACRLRISTSSCL